MLSYLFLWLLVSVVNMHILVFLSPEGCGILLNEAVYVLVRFVNHFSVLTTSHWSEFLSKEVYYTCRLAYFESSVLVVVHAVPSMLTSYGQRFTTIAVDDLTCDFLCVLGCQMDDSMTDFFNIRSSAHRVCVCFFLHY